MTARAASSYVVSLNAEPDRVLLLAAALQEWPVTAQLPESGRPARLDIHCATRKEATRRAASLRALLPARERSRVRLRALAPRDWAERWKRFFPVRRVSERIVIKPTWARLSPRPGDCVVELDPGLSFGTGLHGTTQACLQLLDSWQRRAPRGSVLDVGCGSGILAIAAATLGFPRVLAFDHDPDAVRIARANASRNGVARQVTVIRADLAGFRAPRPFRIVVANVLADPLVTHARRLMAAVSRTAPSGLILSGILDAQYARVARAVAAGGFEETRSLQIGGWRTGCFERARGVQSGRVSDATQRE